MEDEGPQGDLWSSTERKRTIESQDKSRFERPLQRFRSYNRNKKSISKMDGTSGKNE